MPLNREVKIKYLGHSTFLFTTPGGKKLIIDPWVQGNPACPERDRKIEGLDTMLVTHGHFDHIHDAVDLGRKFKPQIGCIFEISQWLTRKGVQNANGMNKGGTLCLNDIRATLVDAKHSCGIMEEDGSILYGGEAAGFVVTFENGFRIYHAGDTCVFGDMKIIAELYQPEVVFLPIGDLYTMSPREAAYACRLMGARKVVPMHFGTFPALSGTAEELRKLVSDLGTEVLEMKPGDVLD
ncbi:MAG: metal-dependent hydrolase [Acidobacteria bacterium]|nr:metal-dependent hydrolase [Acidobacteriota bacterium]